MGTFRPEGGERTGESGQCSDTDCLTDERSQTKAGDVSSAGGAGVGLVSLAFPGLFAHA